MDEASQDEVRAFIDRTEAFGARKPRSAPIETHISIVYLFEHAAIKLKRAVRHSYLDFSTPERRLTACEQEVSLNRRTAPQLYRAVRRITREADGALALDGQGALVDAVVEMTRFDDACVLDRIADRGGLDAPLLTKLAEAIARFHDEATVDCAQATPTAMRAVIDLNERSLHDGKLFSREAIAALTEACRDALARATPLLDARRRAGRVRRCHGDLHLRNVCVIDGEPTLFDCIEFDESLATIDTLYDVAFLLMDLWSRDHNRQANLLFNRYLDASGDEDGLPLIAFFMALRAAIRAHVTAAQARGDRATEARARSYFDLSRRLLRCDPPRLVAVGGLSGSGKSTIAAALAPSIGPAPGARVLSSDRIRKRLHRVGALTRLPAEAYRPEVSQRVYAELVARAETIASAGHGVVADAVFDLHDNRTRIEDAARRAGAPFAGLWLDADPQALVARVEARRNDASDATAAVVHAQVKGRTDDVEWRRIAANQAFADVRDDALRAADVPSP